MESAIDNSNSVFSFICCGVCINTRNSATVNMCKRKKRTKPRTVRNQKIWAGNEPLTSFDDY